MSEISLLTGLPEASSPTVAALLRHGCNVDLREGPISGYLLRRRYLGRICACGLLVVAAPIIAVLSVLIRLTSRGPALFVQSRVGIRGKVFNMVKLRTMYVDAESKCGPTWAARRDPRITKLGRYMRKLHLDELPQLWNVARGEMALIGPRPERPEFVQFLARSVPHYLDRLSVAPGITGLAQIRLPPDHDLEGVRLKLRQDLEYIETACLRLDLRILGCTALRLIGIPGHLAARLFQLQCSIASRPTASHEDKPTALANITRRHAKRERNNKSKPR